MPKKPKQSLPSLQHLLKLIVTKWYRIAQDAADLGLHHAAAHDRWIAAELERMTQPPSEKEGVNYVN